MYACSDTPMMYRSLMEVKSLNVTSFWVLNAYSIMVGGGGINVRWGKQLKIKLQGKKSEGKKEKITSMIKTG